MCLFPLNQRSNYIARWDAAQFKSGSVEKIAVESAKTMNGIQTAIKLLPAVLVWLIEWVLVPFTMLWLCLRWMLWGPVHEKPEDVLTLDERRATKEATAGGALLAIVIFLIFYTTGGQRPMPPEVALPNADAPLALLLGFGDFLVFLIGVAAGLFPRPYRYWTNGKPKLAWLSSLPLVVWLCSGLAVFSLLSYFEWREAHSLALAGFLGLATGFTLAPLFTRCLHRFGKYP